MLTYFTSNLDSMTRILLIKTLSNLELLSADLPYTDIYVLMVSMVSIKNKKYTRCFNQSNCRHFAF